MAFQMYLSAWDDLGPTNREENFLVTSIRYTDSKDKMIFLKCFLHAS